MTKLAPYWKAIFAFLAPGLVILGNALAEHGFDGVTLPLVGKALGVALVTAFTVYLAPKNAHTGGAGAGDAGGDYQGRHENVVHMDGRS